MRDIGAGLFVCCAWFGRLEIASGFIKIKGMTFSLSLLHWTPTLIMAGKYGTE